MDEKGSNETRMEEKKKRRGIKSNVEKKSVSERELGDTRTQKRRHIRRGKRRRCNVRL
jgi:hypothetical protein